MRQKIEWVKSIDDKQYSERTLLENVMPVFGAALFSAVCALIFMGATVLTLTDIYGIEKPGVMWCFCFFAVMLVAGLILETAFGMEKKRWSISISAAVLLLGILGFSTRLWNTTRAEDLFGGIVAFIRLYARNWSARYGESVLWYEGNEKYIEESVYLLLFFLFYIVFWIAKQIKKDGVLIVVPLTVMATQLFVGKTSGKGGFFLLLAGLLLCSSSVFRISDMQPVQWQKRTTDYKKQMYLWMGTGLLFIAVSGGILLLGERMAEKLTEKYADTVTHAVAENAENIKQSELWEQAGISESFTTMLEQWFWDEKVNSETLSNDMPVYEQIAVLEAEVSRKPLQNIYLRGFCGDKYENGSWIKDTNGLKGMCHEAGLDYESVNRDIVYRTIDRIAQTNGISNFFESSAMHSISVVDLGESSTKVFAPYYAKAVTADIKLDGEIFEKKNTITRVNFVQWNQEAFEFFEEEGERYEWEKLYEKYVKERYLFISKEMPVADELTAIIEAQFLDEYTEEQRKAFSQNETRLIKAELTAAWLNENTTYSLILPALAEGEDPIEYFLETSRSGYCMHYAGAAVMLLRNMGVPARYASGYLVPADDFNKAEAGYKATVLDEQRHAWVEIYLDGIGWIPVEVTKSYPAIETTEALLKALPQEEKTEERITQAKAEKKDLLTEEAVSESMEPDAMELSESTEEITQDLLIEEAEKEEAEKEEEKTEAALPKPGMPKSVIWTILGCIVFIGIVAALMMNTHKFFKSESIYYKQLKREMKRGRYKQGIVLINSGIYRKLQYKKLIQQGDGDDAFEAALRANYVDLSKEEWDRYMAIVKSAAFSQKECTQEDMQYCFEVYRDVIYKDEVW